MTVCSDVQLKAVNALFGREVGRALCRGEIDNPLDLLAKHYSQQVQDKIDQAAALLREVLAEMVEAPPEEEAPIQKYFGGSANGNKSAATFEQGISQYLKKVRRA